MHDEVVPGVCRLLRDNGVEPTVFLNSRISENLGDLFALLPDHSDIPRYRPLQSSCDWSDLRSELKSFDLLVLNSFQTDEAAAFAAKLGLPTIGLVHNPQRLVKSAQCVDAVKTGRVSIMTLGRHVTAWLRAKDPEVFGATATISHLFWEMPTEARDTRRLQRIAVPGVVRFRSRDYSALLESIPGVIEVLPGIAFEIAVIGGGLDRTALEQMVADAGLGESFYFTPVAAEGGKVDSSAYYRELAKSAFLLALPPTEREGYRSFRITSVVPASMGFRIPVILDRPSAQVYGIPCLSYRGGDIGSGIIHALSSSDDAYRRLWTELDHHRAVTIERARGEMARLLRDLGDRPTRRRAGPASFGTKLSALVRRAPRSGSTADRDDRAAFLDFVRHALRHTYAQRFQDLWALWECGFPSEGYFVEFGAQHGRHGSNTYLLEQLGWRGVVAEPHPDYGQSLRNTRACAVSTKCVYDRSGEVVKFHAVKDRPALSTIEGFGDDLRRELRSDFTTHEVETISLNDLLAEASAPRQIQFLSIDTEGSELRILEAFDFARYEISCICVEHNYSHREDLLELLTNHGFRRKWRKISDHDDWYVNDALIPSWDPDNIPTALSRIGSVAPVSKKHYERRLQILGRLEPPDSASQRARSSG
jgi:FkbM family methyltransferase